MTQRIEFSFVHDSKNWTFFCTWLKELSLFVAIWPSKNWALLLQMTQRIEPLFPQIWIIESFLRDSTNWYFFLRYVSKNCFLLLWNHDSHELNLFFLNMTQKIEPSLQHERERISVAPAALSVNWSKLREPFDEGSTSLIHQLHLNWRTLPLSWHSKLCSCGPVSRGWLVTNTSRCASTDSVNSSLSDDSKNWTFLFWMMTPRIEPLWFFFEKNYRWLQELNLL